MAHALATHLRLLLLRLLVLLVTLRLGDRRLARGHAVRGGLVPLRGDGGKVGTNDPTLVLHGAPGALLRNLLRDTLLVHASVDLRPGDLARVLALEEERLILGGREAEDLYDTKRVE